MKKKRSIRNFIILAILLSVCFIFCFVSFRIPTTANNFAGFVNGIYRGIDLNGGVTATYTVEFSEKFDGDMNMAVDQACNRVENLLSDEFTEYYVERVDEDKIRITIPRLSDDTTILTNNLVNYITFTTEEVDDPETFEPKFTGDNITSAKYFTANGTFGTLIEFNDEGKEALKEMANSLSSNATLYIYQDKDYSSVLLRITVDKDSLTSIADSKQLFVSDIALFQTKSDAVAFADKVASGMLNVDMSLEGEMIETSPSMGEFIPVVVLLIIIASIVASFIYLIIKYRQLAVATIMSLLSFVAISAVMMPLIKNIQMSMVGFVAFLLIYAITFIAHVMYIERAKNDFTNGKKLVASFKSSYVKSILAITDIYLCVVLASIVSVIVCAGAIKTIAMIALLLSLPGALTSMLIHRGLIKWYLDINPTKYKKINFVKGVTKNEE